MADIDISTTPYFDTYDDTKDWTMLLFNPDRPLQQRELNELQSTLGHYIGALGNSIMHDGDIQSGMGYTQDGNNITVNSGSVYLAGKVRSYSGQTVTLTGTGMETVGVKISQSIVKASDDSSLNDPTQDVPSAGSAGADRLKETVVLTVNDSTAATIYTFNNAVLYRQNLNSQLSQVQDIMARRTFETNGNYRVGATTGKETGFLMTLSPDTDDTTKVTLNIQPGIAFVQGYEVSKPNPTRLALDKSTETETITSEQHVYHAGTDVYSLAVPNVKAVNQVSAQIQQNFTITHGSQDGTDFIVNNLISVDKVYTEGTSGRTFTEGTDYRVSGNSVDWSFPTGQEPAVNSSYVVTATYNKVLTGDGVDYTATISSDVNGISTISFAGATGSGNTAAYVPKDQGYITINYDIYWARIDIITLNKDGDFVIHKGQPARADLVSEPDFNDPFTLRIGAATLYPNSSTGSVSTDAVTNLTMDKLQKIVARVQNIEYNEALQSLDNQTIQDHTPVTLRGIFTDAFVTLDRFDESYDSRGTATDGFKSNVMFSFDDGRITLPKDSEDPHQAQIIGDSSTAAVWGHLITAPFTEFPIVQQLQATEFMSVVPFDNTKEEGSLTISPSADNWVDTTHTVVYNQQYYTYATGRWWIHHNLGNAKSNTENYYNERTDWDWATHAAKGWQSDLTGTITQSGGTTTTDQQIQYMRPQTITFVANGLKVNQDNLVLRFNNVIVPIVPAQGYTAGSTVAGSIMADGSGVAKGSFQIPDNVLCGKVAVVLDSDGSSAETTYVAQGINKVTTDTIITTYVTAHLVDPLGQSFQTLDARQLSSVDLYFGSKSTTNNVTITIRGMADTGMPNNIVYATQVLTPSQVNVSSDASAVTKVAFDDPVMTTPGSSYVVVAGSSSADYTLAVARSGSNLLGTNTKVTGQPYQEGVLFLSSNGQTWTPDQSADLKFVVNAAKYNPTATMEFSPFVNLSLDEFVLFASYLTPDNTGCTWEYRILYDGATGDITTQPYKALSSYVKTDAEGVAKAVQLRATFTANEYISPLLSLDDLQFGAFTTALRGDYVSVTVPMDASPFNTISLDYPVNLPGQSAIVPQYSLDKGATWINFQSTPTTTQVSTEWTNIHYTETLSSLQKSFKLHFKLTTANPYQRPSVDQVKVALTNE
ncbi:putative tail protein [Lactobacillus phage Lb338-1]|uniref:Putative tail protein n=1 Tax=Lactobacillus phage Lb338-1 TaxID=2892342 RepID=C1KFP4_9CAUD|nr:putative tail protein [Lactobacillus phage Lb338-1]ACO37055.1 putative tail protein [Lactobacillus phage Lb338-1]